ncbi:hypothetical protein ACHAXR_009227 [Thalassiosira sp. AJA248-18]
MAFIFFDTTYTVRIMLRRLISFLLAQLLVAPGAAFTACPRPALSKSLSAATKLYASASPLGDLFSGITGVAPSSLSPPDDVLAGTFIDPARDDVDLGRVYKATKDGWSAINFHKCVDGKGSAFVVALSKSGKRFGGFNPLGWMSSDDYGNSNAAFLWFEKGGKTMKCPILPGGNTAIYDFASGGPNFGAADFCIGPPRAAVMGGFTGPDVENSESVAGNLRKGRSSVGGAYEFQKGWPVAGEFQLAEVEVWCNLNAGRRRSSRGGRGLFG